MKKIIILSMFFVLLLGCEKKEEVVEKPKVEEKVENTKRCRTAI